MSALIQRVRSRFTVCSRFATDSCNLKRSFMGSKLESYCHYGGTHKTHFFIKFASQSLLAWLSGELHGAKSNEENGGTLHEDRWVRVARGMELHWNVKNCPGRAAAMNCCRAHTVLKN